MTYFTVVSNDYGVGIFGKRQSSDKNLLMDIINHAKNEKIYVSEYTYKIFLKNNLEQNITREKKEKYIFLEIETLKDKEEEIEELIIYSWNRDYPSDKFLEINLEKYNLEKETEFKGNSHEKITKKIFRRIV